MTSSSFSQLLRLLRGFVRLSPPGAAQNIFERVVRFVTGVLKNVFIGRRPGKLAGPRPCPCGWIFNRKPVKQRIGSDARETFDNVEVLTRSTEPCLVGEVGGVDNECVSFPMTDGVAHPLADRLRQMLRVHAYDAGIV